MERVVKVVSGVEEGGLKWLTFLVDKSIVFEGLKVLVFMKLDDSAAPKEGVAWGSLASFCGRGGRRGASFASKHLGRVTFVV